MKALVVGGAGYIGSHFVRLLCDYGWDVTAFDNLSTGHPESVDTRAKLLVGDMCGENMTRRALRISEPNIVFCFAGLKAAGESMIDPAPFARTNISGTINLLDAMQEQNVKYFVFSSSAAVYGIPKQIPIVETHPTNPTNFYGFTKLEIERVLEWYSRLNKIRYASLRYFNAAGYSVVPSDHFTPHRENAPTNLLPVVMETALAERKLVNVFGDDYDTPDGTGIRDYIHVDDLADAHLKAAHCIINEHHDLVVNLGTEKGYSVLEVLNAAEKITGRTIPFQKVDRREGDVDKVISSSSEARERLGWFPEFSDLETILNTMWNVYNRK